MGGGGKRKESWKREGWVEEGRDREEKGNERERKKVKREEKRGNGEEG